MRRFTTHLWPGNTWTTTPTISGSFVSIADPPYPCIHRPVNEKSGCATVVTSQSTHCDRDSGVSIDLLWQRCQKLQQSRHRFWIHPKALDDLLHRVLPLRQLHRKSCHSKTQLGKNVAWTCVISLKGSKKCVSERRQIFWCHLVKIVCNLGEDQITRTAGTRRSPTLVLKVCAAKTLAEAGESGFWRRTLQAAQASGYDKWRIADKSEVLVGRLARGERQITECWKS